MERCPFELWGKIVAFACTDGGHTGCSLSLVSRTMHDVVKPVRYHSVSLVGERQLHAFVARLAALNLPPVIHHLFISVEMPRYNTMTIMEESLALEVLETAQAKPTSKTEMELMMRNILSSSASNLYSLVIHNYYDFDLTVNLPDFPLLHDITIGYVPSDCAADAHARFPSLRRLHLLSISRRMPVCWLKLRDFAPHITHFRMSSLSLDRHISPFLRILLDIPPPLCPRRSRDDCFSGKYIHYRSGSEKAKQAVIVASRLSTLEYVYVQPRVDCPSGRRAPGHLAHNQMMDGLKSIASASARGEGVGKFFLMPQQEFYTLDDLHKDWIETVEGNDGPWPGGRGDSLSAVVRAKWPEEHPAYHPLPSSLPAGTQRVPWRQLF